MEKNKITYYLAGLDLNSAGYLNYCLTKNIKPNLVGFNDKIVGIVNKILKEGKVKNFQIHNQHYFKPPTNPVPPPGNYRTGGLVNPIGNTQWVTQKGIAEECGLSYIVTLIGENDEEANITVYLDNKFYKIHPPEAEEDFLGPTAGVDIMFRLEIELLANEQSTYSTINFKVSPNPLYVSLVPWPFGADGSMNTIKKALDLGFKFDRFQIN